MPNRPPHKRLYMSMSIYRKAWRLPEIALFVAGVLVLSVCLAEMACPAEVHDATPTCSYMLSLWTPAQVGTSTSQWIQPAARAEGICDFAFGIRAWGRGDMLAIPGRAAPTDFNLSNVGAIEAWGGLSRVVRGPFSAAVFGGLQRPLQSGATLGVGGITSSWCAGARVALPHGFTVAGICTRYAPAEVTKVNAGPAIGGTVVFRVTGPVGMAVNFARVLKTGDQIYSVGPTASWTNR